MASGRLAVGGLAIAAVFLALVVAGCGGGNSSASGAAGGGSSTAAGAPANTESTSAADQSSGSSQSEGKGDGTKKKHPPLQLPVGEPEEGATKAQREAVPTADMEVAIPEGALSTDNTCKGKNLSPAFEWRKVPPGTVELALFVVNLQPVEGKLYFDWAVAGIDPSLEGLKAGEVPQGAVVGRGSDGKNAYSLCPQGSRPENYIFALYALPRGVSPRSGFDPLTLRKEATKLSQSVGIYSAAY